MKLCYSFRGTLYIFIGEHGLHFLLPVWNELVSGGGLLVELEVVVLSVVVSIVVVVLG
jgi:hypothetical protein